MWATTEPVKQVNLHHSWTSVGGVLGGSKRPSLMNQPSPVLPIRSPDMKGSLVHLVQWSNPDGRVALPFVPASRKKPLGWDLLAQLGTICRWKSASCSSCPLPCDCWQAFETHPIDEFYLTAAPPGSPGNSLPAIGSCSQLAIPAPWLLWTGAK